MMLKWQRSQGFSLVELMVSVTISSIITIGLFNLMMNFKKNYRLDRNLAQIQQNGYFAVKFLSRAIHLSGFRDAPDFTNMKIFSDYADVYPVGEQYISGTFQDTNNSDTLTVRYQGSSFGNIFDCVATEVQPGQMAVNTFFINNNSELVCNASIDGVNNAENPSVLVEGVEAMHIRYGEDLNNNGMVDRYVPANFSDLDFSRVISVRVSLLLRSPESVAPVVNDNVYNLQDVALGPFNDHTLRKVYTNTVKRRSVKS